MEKIGPDFFLKAGEEPRYALDMRLGGLQSWSGRCGGEENLLTPVWNRTPAIQLVTTPTELWRLLFVSLFYVVPHCYTYEYFDISQFHFFYIKYSKYISKSSKGFSRTAPQLIIHPDVLSNGIMVNE